MKTILYATTVGSSTANFLNGQLAHFREQGWDVHVACTPDSDFERAIEREQVVGHRLPMAREISLRQDIVSLVQWVRLVGRVRPDVVNVGTPKAALLGAIAAWLWRVPIRIYTVRGLRFESESGHRRRLLQAMEWVTLLCSTSAISVSPSVRRVMIDSGMDFRPIAVIGSGSSNGVDIDPPVPSTRPTRDQLGLSRDAWVIGYVGRLQAAKGADTLAAAINDLDGRGRPIELLIIGPVEDRETERSLESLTVRSCSTGWVNDARPYYSLMDVLCLPTQREGFPNVVLEAAVAGVPAITTTATGAIDSVIHNETGLLIPPGDEHALRDALLSLYGSPDRVATLGANAQERAKRDFRRARIWAGLEQIYRGSVIVSGDVTITEAQGRSLINSLLNILNVKNWK